MSSPRTACEECRSRKVKCKKDNRGRCQECKLGGLSCTTRSQLFPGQLILSPSKQLKVKRSYIESFGHPPYLENEEQILDHSWEQIVDSFSEGHRRLSFWRSIDAFKILFSKRNPHTKALSKGWDLIRGIDVLPDQDLRYIGFGPIPTPCSSLARQIPNKRYSGLVENASQSSDFSGLESHLAIAFDLARAGDVFSSLQELEQVRWQACRRGLHLLNGRALTFADDSDIRVALWRQIIDLDSGLSLAIGCRPGFPSSSIPDLETPPGAKRVVLDSCAETRRIKIQLERTIRLMLEEKSWSNTTIKKHSEHLIGYTKILDGTSASSPQESFAITHTLLRIHACIFCVNCKAEFFAKQPTKSLMRHNAGPEQPATDQSLKSTGIKKRGTKAYEACCERITYSARTVLRLFSNIHELPKVDLGQDWLVCNYAFTAAAILGIARFESADNLTVDNEDYILVAKLQAIFSQLSLANPTSHLLRLAATRLLHILTDGGNPAAGRADAQLHWSSTGSGKNSSGLFPVAREAPPHILASSITSTQLDDVPRPEETVTVKYPNTTPQTLSPRDYSSATGTTRSAKRQKMTQTSSRRSSLPVHDHSLSHQQYQAAVQSVPTNQVIEDNFLGLGCSEDHAAFNSGGYANFSLVTDHNDIDQEVELEHAAVQIVDPLMLSDDYQTLQLNMQFSSMSKHYETDLPEWSYPALDLAQTHPPMVLANSTLAPLIDSPSTTPVPQNFEAQSPRLQTVNRPPRLRNRQTKKADERRNHHRETMTEDSEGPKREQTASYTEQGLSKRLGFSKDGFEVSTPRDSGYTSLSTSFRRANPSADMIEQVETQTTQSPEAQSETVEMPQFRHQGLAVGNELGSSTRNVDPVMRMLPGPVQPTGRAFLSNDMMQTAVLASMISQNDMYSGLFMQNLHQGPTDQSMLQQVHCFEMASANFEGESQASHLSANRVNERHAMTAAQMDGCWEWRGYYEE